MKSAFSTRGQRGFALVEIMVAMLLGLFLLGGGLQVVMHSKKTYRTQDALSRMQENGRFALYFLAQDIREAGYRGACIDDKVVANSLFDSASSFLYNFNTAIQGFDASTAPGVTNNVWSPTIDSTFPTSALYAPMGGSDIITIRKADETGYAVKAHDVASVPPFLQLTSKSSLAKCDSALVTNCDKAVVFHVTDVAKITNANDKITYAAGKCMATVPAGNKITTATDPDYTTMASFDPTKPNANIQIYPINTISYYVRKNPGNQPALYRKIGSKPAEELIEGIEKMQILYGVDTDITADGTANYYVTADKIPDLDLDLAPDWRKVVSMRVSLLLVSPDNNLTNKPVSYTYNGIKVDPPAGDLHIRKVFTSTIALRNHLS